MKIKQNTIIYFIITISMFAFILWQIQQHKKMTQQSRAIVENRARDIASTLGIVIQSQRRFVAVPRSRLTIALQGLAKSPELISVALLSPNQEIVAAGGKPLPQKNLTLPIGTNKWQNNNYITVQVVELGKAHDGKEQNTALAIDRSDMMKVGMFNFQKQKKIGPKNKLKESENYKPEKTTQPPHFGYGRRRGYKYGTGRHYRNSKQWQQHFQELYKKRGLHQFILVLSTKFITKEIKNDFYSRILISIIALIACIAIATTWHINSHANQLNIRLIKAKEMNAHLREMNIAAAGLAHETKNPLNIVRGLTQMISRENTLPEKLKQSSCQVLAEVDRITNRLNEFIEYSRPRKAKLKPVNITELINDIKHTLQTDSDDKKISLKLQIPNITIQADEALLRQVIFNLLLNAYQIVGENGKVNITLTKIENNQTKLEISDNGPGIEPQYREDIFKPYFTMSEKGTGLGLAIVRQIVQAHRWDIKYIEKSQKGACFQIKPIQIIAPK